MPPDDDTDDDGTPATDAATDDKPDGKPLGDKGKKALDDERSARKKAERDLAAVNKRLREIEDKDKDETTRLAERVAELEKDLGAATADRDRLHVAVSKGLSEADARRVTGAARRLHGATVEELEDDAEDYFADRPPADDTGDTKPPPGGAPRERLKAGDGSDADTPVEETDIKALGERMFSH